MKIWIDLTNSPHINFFKPLIKEWERDGNTILITCRDLANTIDLIQQNGWQYNEIGSHAGKNYFKKIISFLIRTYKLINFIKNQKPDIAISHSSFHSPLVAKLLGIPSIYLNDNEHAKGNYMAFKFASLIYLPEFLAGLASELEWDKKKNIRYYPGIKEGIYLSKEYFKKSEKKHNDIHLFFRPEPWTAQYYKGGDFFLDDLLQECKAEYKITILPRGKAQAEHYKTEEFRGIIVSEKAIDLEEIYRECDLFIGAGGTMTRELAFLGIPTISIYQDELLEVDKYLIQNNFMYHETKPKLILLKQILANKTVHNNSPLREKGDDAFLLISNSIYNYGETKN
jgi:predicted glycosyltransferase